MGLALGLDKDGLDVIQADHRDDMVRQRTEMFDLWLHNGEVTGEVLVKALVDTNNIEAALKLCDIKGKTTVKPLNNGHAWDSAFCPLYVHCENESVYCTLNCPNIYTHYTAKTNE